MRILRCLAASLLVLMPASAFSPTRAFPPTHSTGSASPLFLYSLSTKKTVRVSLPTIHWTVPGYKVGWQDDSGNWYDEDGPRNGPPMNYWRQSSDQREYDRDVGLARAVLADGVVEERVRAVERRRSVRSPLYSRKILGSWAPLLIAGRKVGEEDGEGITVPFRMDVRRTKGRKLAERTAYGVFDAKLEEGEEITVEVNSSPPLSTIIEANANNDVYHVGTVDCGAELSINIGGNTFLSDYLLIQRNSNDDIDFWIRCDDSHLGVKEQ